MSLTRAQVEARLAAVLTIPGSQKKKAVDTVLALIEECQPQPMVGISDHFRDRAAYKEGYEDGHWDGYTDASEAYQHLAERVFREGWLRAERSFIENEGKDPLIETTRLALIGYGEERALEGTEPFDLTGYAADVQARARELVVARLREIAAPLNASQRSAVNKAADAIATLEFPPVYDAIALDGEKEPPADPPTCPPGTIAREVAPGQWECVPIPDGHDLPPDDIRNGGGLSAPPAPSEETEQ